MAVVFFLYVWLKNDMNVVIYIKDNVYVYNMEISGKEA